MTIREEAHKLWNETNDNVPYRECVTKMEEFGKQCIERFRTDLLDFLSVQPDHMMTRENVLGMVRNLKPELGQ